MTADYDVLSDREQVDLLRSALQCEDGLTHGARVCECATGRRVHCPVCDLPTLAVDPGDKVSVLLKCFGPGRCRSSSIMRELKTLGLWGAGRHMVRRRPAPPPPAAVPDDLDDRLERALAKVLSGGRLAQFAVSDERLERVMMKLMFEDAEEEED